MTPTVLAITSDHHAGSTVALCPPKIKLDDAGGYEASKAQLWLWERWRAFWWRVDQVRNARRARLIAAFNGDLTEGQHHRTTQILSGNRTIQAEVVRAVLELPLSLKPDGIIFTRGTEAHVGPSAAYEEAAARGLLTSGQPVIVDKDTGNASHWNAVLDINGVRVDLAHHGRIGQRPWTKINVVANYAAEIFYEHAKDGRPHPHLAVRSHLHQYADTFNAHPVRLIQLPAWQLATAFVHRIKAGAIADIGGIIVTIGDGVFDVEPVIYRPDPPSVVRFS